MAVDLSESIEEVQKIIVAVGKSREQREQHEKVLELLETAHSVYYNQIHNYLVPKNDWESELQVRALVRQCDTVIKFIEKQIKMLDKGKDIVLLSKYLDLYDDFYALCAFRSLKHFVLYMEFDKKKEEKLWEPTMHLFGGFWYYANSMILNGDVKVITKQCFTGLGKTYSNAMLLSFIYGYDVNSDALYVFGASENVGSFTSGLVDLMCSKRYAKVFPFYKQFQGEDSEQTANRMFIIRQCKDTGSKLRITGSKKAMNLRVVSKDKNTNGVRAKYLFLDDVAQLADANNPKAHQKDIFRLTNEWFKRNYDLRNFFVIAGGTTYSVDDILTYLLHQNNIESAVPACIKGVPINKFTKIANSDYIISGGKTVFVCVPKLDYDTDESTYPEKYPTEDARRQRDNALDNGRMFAAMEQQMPLSAEENPFSYGNVHTYDVLPDTDLEKGTRNHKCRFILDPSRKGNDKTCCLFFSQDGDRHYLVDAFCERQPLDHKYSDGETTLDRICNKIIKHNCFEGRAEENTESTIVSQILSKLAKRDYQRCKVKGYYSYKVKKDKINAAQTAIQSYIWFPSRKVFAPNSEVGSAMTDIIYWQYKDNIADDAPECCAVYCDEFIGVDTIGYASFHTFKR